MLNLVKGFGIVTIWDVRLQLYLIISHSIFVVRTWWNGKWRVSNKRLQQSDRLTSQTGSFLRCRLIYKALTERCCKRFTDWGIKHAAGEIKAVNVCWMHITQKRFTKSSIVLFKVYKICKITNPSTWQEAFKCVWFRLLCSVSIAVPWVVSGCS